MNHFCVFDFETDKVNPEICGVTEVACLMIDPYNLEIIPDSSFFSHVKPIDIDNPDYLDKDRLSTLQFHCKNSGKSQEEILQSWRNAPPMDVVWPQFVSHVNKYNRTGKVVDAPWACGANIINFDLIISNRLNNAYKIKKLFGYEAVDIRHLAVHWLIWDRDLTSRSMDSLRKYMGLPSDGAHTALADVHHEALVLQKFLKLHKMLHNKVKFKNCFQTSEEE